MEIADYLLEQHPEIDTWVEPFLGSGVVAFNCPDRIQKVIVKSGLYPAMPKADAIVYAEPGCEIAAIKAANELREQGMTVENALFDDIETVREYAKEKKIAKVVVVDGASREEE